VRYADGVPSEASATEDTRIWVGRVAAGREAEHASFLAWLNGPDAHDIFRRRRLTAYRLTEQDGTITVVLKAPHTGDPRLMIDVLRYPGLWPDYWEFIRGGRGDDASAETPPPSTIRVDWHRSAEAAA
jgi:hypothetical protein